CRRTWTGTWPRLTNTQRIALRRGRQKCLSHFLDPMPKGRIHYEIRSQPLKRLVGCSAVAVERVGPAIAYYKGGWFCQSAHFNRADADAPRRTASAYA